MATDIMPEAAQQVLRDRLEEMLKSGQHVIIFTVPRDENSDSQLIGTLDPEMLPTAFLTMTASLAQKKYDEMARYDVQTGKRSDTN